MNIYIGSDHGGIAQKSFLMASLQEKGYTVIDCGAYSNESTDYPDFALAVGRAVQNSNEHKGILLCRSGEGMEMAANKMKNIRAALVWREDVARETRRDNDANIVVLPSDFISDEEAIQIVTTFLETEFSAEERHIRRLEKLSAIENGRYAS